MVTPAQLPRLSRRGAVPGVRQARADLLERGAVPVGVRGTWSPTRGCARSAAGHQRGHQRPAHHPRRRSLLADYRAEHPLARIFPLLYDVLGQARAEDCDSVMAVADEHGQLLWVSGRPAVLRRAEAISFVEGAQWDERHAGTNAPGTALRLDAPVTIKSAEHFVRPVQRWSCAAAPIHDPGSDAILGVVDVTGGDDIGSPQTIAMVRAAARMAEAELARIAAGPAAAGGGARPRWRCRGCGGAPSGGCSLQRASAGPTWCSASGRRTLRLSPRHSEILVGARRPPGRADRRRAGGHALSGRRQPGHAAGRAGPAALAARRRRAGLPAVPARCEVTSDWAAVAAQLAAGDLAAALRLYRGRCCRTARRPAWSELRADLHGWLRAAGAGRRRATSSWSAGPRARWGADDLEMWQRQCALLPPRSSPLRPRRRGELAATPSSPRPGRPAKPGRNVVATLRQLAWRHGSPAVVRFTESPATTGSAEGEPPWRSTSPGQAGQPRLSAESRYGNFIGGEWVAAGQGPVLREHHAGHRPAVHRDRPRRTAEDIELALDAAHGAKRGLGPHVARPSAPSS